MKYILLILCLLILPFRGTLAATLPSTEVHQEAPSSLKPIKVSEINANLFSSIYDFFQQTGKAVLEGFVSLKDFVELGDWFIKSIKTPDTRYQLASFSVQLVIVLFVSFVLAQGLSSWLKPRIQTFLSCKKKPSFEKMKSLLSATFLSTLAPLLLAFFSTRSRVFLTLTIAFILKLRGF
jgi:hypothetical protein